MAKSCLGLRSGLYWIKGIQNLKQWQSQTATCNADQRQRTGPDKIAIVRNRIAYAQESLVRQILVISWIR